MTTRRFFRCSCCLGVLAVDDSADVQACGACLGTLEPMGSVYRSERVGSSCACDLRCTHALGPECNCKCGGANHGQGLVVPVVVGKAKPADSVAAFGRASEWIGSVGQFEAEMLSMEPRRRRRASRALRWARASRVHRLRMACLRDFLSGKNEITEAVLELDLGVCS